MSLKLTKFMSISNIYDIINSVCMAEFYSPEQLLASAVKYQKVLNKLFFYTLWLVNHDLKLYFLLKSCILNLFSSCFNLIWILLIIPLKIMNWLSLFYWCISWIAQNQILLNFGWTLWLGFKFSILILYSTFISALFEYQTLAITLLFLYSYFNNVNNIFPTKLGLGVVCICHFHLLLTPRFSLQFP